MARIFIISILFLGFYTSLFSQETEVEIPTKSVVIKGTLLQPEKVEQPPLVIIIPGSGPTDRDGNNSMMKNNSLKLLAKGLYENNIASYRYDKSALHYPKEIKLDTLSFDTFVYEAKEVVHHFKKRADFSKIIILGHSQGSLVGMLAVTKDVNGFISVAGAGKSIDKILLTQISLQAPFLIEETKGILKELKAENKVEKVNPMLAPLFKPSIQTFLISWIKHNPAEILQKLKIPILIINGTKDLQVAESNAKLLHEKQPASKLILIENMNHVLKEIDGDSMENMKSYNQPDLPVSPKLIEAITKFINNYK